MTYLLDANVVIYFSAVRGKHKLARAAQRCSMALVEEVRQELEHSKSIAEKADFREWLNTSNIPVLSFEVGSSASNTFAQLLNPASSKETGGAGSEPAGLLAATL